MKILLCLLLLAGTCFAQESKVSLRLISFPRLKDAPPVMLKAGETLVEIEPPSNRLSDPIEVPPAARWAVGGQVEDAEGKTVFKRFGAVDSGSAASQILILLRRGPEPSDGFKLICIDDKPAEFGDRKIYFLNLARQEIAGDVGSVKFGLKPGDQMVVAPKADQGKDLCHAALYLKRKEEWRPFMSSNWPLKKDTRGLIFIYNDPSSGRIRLHTVRDFL